eukprot:3342800-Alexandrium_andersonii.AAC.1
MEGRAAVGKLHVDGVPRINPAECTLPTGTLDSVEAGGPDAWLQHVFGQSFVNRGATAGCAARRAP